jgi:hypothetical protein
MQQTHATPPPHVNLFQRAPIDATHPAPNFLSNKNKTRDRIKTAPLFSG